MNQLKVITYNIWFDQTNIIDRTISLLDVINNKKPDVICLQEVRPDIYTILIGQLKDYKYNFPKKINLNYGCVIFSKYPITKCLNYDYENSTMGRGLKIAKIDYPYKLTNNLNNLNNLNNNTKIEIIIATTHFESLFKSYCNEKKINQFTIAKDVLNSLNQKYKNIIFCVDSNVLPYEEEIFNSVFDNTWTDAWKIKGDDTNKFTFDNQENCYLKEKYPKKNYRSRFDRILFKTNQCILDNFGLIKGNNLINPTNNNMNQNNSYNYNKVEPSDHFGIETTFILNNS